MNRVFAFVLPLMDRYTVMNRCDCVLVVSQYGSDVSMELEPGEFRPLHWADGRRERIRPCLIENLDRLHDYLSRFLLCVVSL